MRIQTRILLFQLVVATAILATGITVYTSITSTEYYVQRVELAHRQLEALIDLSLRVNRHSEQIAEVLLVGPEQNQDLLEARDQVEAALLTLARLIDDELEFVTDPVELAREREELVQLGQLRGVYQQIDMIGARLIQIDSDGRQDEAVTLFRSQIEHGLEPRFDALLSETMDEEREEVDEVERRSRDLAVRLTVGTLTSALVLLAASLLGGHVLARSLVRPVAALARGAAAIRRGELEHRIDHRSADELGELAQQFDAMAAELADYRDQMLAARQDLEVQVAQRTEQLAGANQRLLDLDRVRLQFLADIGHELRTPLTVMRGEAEVTLRGRVTDEATFRETLTRIVDQAVEMGRLVEDLLFLARSEADQIRFERRRISLGPLLHEARKEAAALARRREVRIIGEVTQGKAQLDADPQRLKQAIVILLDNAIKHSGDRGEVRLAASVEHGRAEIVVNDQGTGIAAEDLPYVFDRFYRGKGARGGGSGLGLSIARWIIEKHDGKIAIDSKPGFGTTARLELPCGVTVA